MVFQSQYLLIPRMARRSLMAARVLVALLLLAAANTPAAYAASGTYTAFALGVFFVPRLERPPWNRAALAADAILPFFSDWSADPMRAPLLMLWFFFLACSLVMLHDWLETTVTAAAWLGIAGLVLKLDITPQFFLGALALVATSLKTQFESRIHKMSRQSVMYRAEAMSARDEERERIANDFHDGPLQSFMSLQMRLEVARRMLDKDHDKGMGEVRQLQEFWQNQVDSLRAFVHVIRQSHSAPTDLGSALKLLSEAFEKESGVKVNLDCRADLRDMDPGPSEELMQLFREALHNIQKHASATHVDVSISDGPGAIEISIHDDGKGFPFEGSYTLEELDALAKGPASIRKRVHNLEGGLKLDSHPGKGSTLRIRVPR